MSEKLPKVVREETMNIEDCKFRVCVLDNGQRVIPKDDFYKVMEWIGLEKEAIDEILKNEEVYKFGY